MRILILSDLWLPFPGGAERYISNVADALVARGHEVSVLTSYALAKPQNPAIPIIIEDIGVYDRHAEGVNTILDFINDPLDLILTHHFFAGEFAKLLTVFAASELPFVEIIHNRQRHPSASLAIFNSRHIAERSGYRAGDIIMLPPAGANTVAETSGDYIGHIKPLGGKGIDCTYRLAQAFPERKFLVLRGEWQNSEDIQRFPNVEFMEPVDDIREFYSRCRLLLMPSLSEDAGTVPQECALNGIPCISSNVGGLPETNGGGILLPPNDVTAWAEQILRLDKPDYYLRTAHRQREYVAGLNWEGKFDEIDRKVRAICGK